MFLYFLFLPFFARFMNRFRYKITFISKNKIKWLYFPVYVQISKWKMRTEWTGTMSRRKKKRKLTKLFYQVDLMFVHDVFASIKSNREPKTNELTLKSVCCILYLSSFISKKKKNGEVFTCYAHLKRKRKTNQIKLI